LNGVASIISAIASLIVAVGAVIATILKNRREPDPNVTTGEGEKPPKPAGTDFRNNLLVAAGTLFIIALVFWGLPHFQTSSRGNGGTQPSSAPITSGTIAAANAASPTPAPKAKLTSPRADARVSVSHGFTVRGTVTGLGKDTIWIVDYDGGYTVDTQATVIGKSWSATDNNLEGTGNAMPFTVTTQAFIATPVCASSLTNIQASTNNYVYKMPPGCRIFGQVPVNVSKP
jgi:hypothetical protein